MPTIEIRKISNASEINNDPNVIYFEKDNNNFKCKISDQTGDNVFDVTDTANADTLLPTFTGNVYIGQTVTFRITNYSSFKNYNVSATVGSVVRDIDEINYTAPMTAQEGGFMVNGRTVHVTVHPITLKAPSITQPAANATDLQLPVVVYSTGLEVNEPGIDAGNFTHETSDWQLATDINFTNIVEQSLADIVSKTGWDTSLAVGNSTYYVRVRYHTTELGVTPWSQPIMFSTVQELLLPIYDIQKIVGSDSLGLDLYDNQITDDNFGISSDIDYTGNRIVVGADGNSSYSAKDGRVYIFKNNGSDHWIEETMISDINPTADNQYGYSVSITDNGDRVAIGVPGVFNDTYSAAGYVYVYARTGTTWVLEATLRHPALNSGDNFGSCVNFDANGDRLAIASFGLASLNGVHIFKRTVDTWSLEQTLTSDDVNTSLFGKTLQLNADGSKIVIGSNVIIQDAIGEVYVFTRTGTVWTKQTILAPTDTATVSNFGDCVAINPSGDKIFVNANDYSLAYQNTYQFNYNAGWSEVAMMQHSINNIDNKLSLGKNGDFLIVGYCAEPNNDYTGDVYLFYSDTGILPQADVNNISKINSPEVEAGKKFGFTVCVSGDGMVAFVTQTGNNHGAGFIYVTYP